MLPCAPLFLASIFALFNLGHCDTRIIPIFVESVVGSTTLHQKQNWKFDPNEASRRNPDFEREHGHKAVILIEKLGLGIDGHQQQRKAQQIFRDSIPIDNYVTQNLIHSR